jgi:hypothetical protein
MNQKEITVKYYYLRDIENKPRVTVCFAHDPEYNVFARGVAVCSKKDNPSKRVGRAIAYQRCQYALCNKAKELPYREGFLFPKMARNSIPEPLMDGFKAEFNPTELTPIEMKLIRKGA